MPERVRKRLFYLMRRPPHGSIFAQKGLETVLIGAAFDQSVSPLVLDDGVFVLQMRWQFRDGFMLTLSSRRVRSRSAPWQGIGAQVIENRRGVRK